MKTNLIIFCSLFVYSCGNECREGTDFILNKTGICVNINQYSNIHQEVIEPIVNLTIDEYAKSEMGGRSEELYDSFNSELIHLSFVASLLTPNAAGTTSYYTNMRGNVTSIDVDIIKNDVEATKCSKEDFTLIHEILHVCLYEHHGKKYVSNNTVVAHPGKIYGEPDGLQYQILNKHLCAVCNICSDEN